MNQPVKPDNAREGNSCCEWLTFYEGYKEALARWFNVPATAMQWSWAVRDWKAGNAGWEAAHNAQRRAKARVRREASEMHIHVLTDLD